LRVGDPMDERTDVGPLAFRAHYKRVLGYLEVARREGATIAHGGARPDGFSRGFFVEPTVLTDLDDAHDGRSRGDLRPGHVDAHLA
jgi:aminomuconate-semialdehyde/2-hydroxymuconate-6-semialdehyde dehydrogenase